MSGSIRAALPGQSILAPESLTTFAHLTISALMNALNSTDELPPKSAPEWPRLAPAGKAPEVTPEDTDYRPHV